MLFLVSARPHSNMSRFGISSSAYLFELPYGKRLLITGDERRLRQDLACAHFILNGEAVSGPTKLLCMRV